MLLPTIKLIACIVLLQGTPTTAIELTNDACTVLLFHQDTPRHEVELELYLLHHTSACLRHTY